VDKHGIGHFYGHAKESENMAEIILKRLKMERETTRRILLLIRYHDFRIEAKSELVKEWLCKLGKENFEDLLLLKKADLAGQNPLGGKKNRKLEALYTVTKDVLERGQCYQLKDLQIDGNDLIENGMQSGEQIGRILRYTLQRVIRGEVENEKEMLLDFLIKEGLL